MKIAGRKGRQRLHLERPETMLLSELLDDLDEVLAEESTSHDDVLERLYPSAYHDDAEAEAEFRTLTEDGLRADRIRRIEACRAELAGGTDIELADAEVAQRWIKVLNDLRLTAGTRLGITEDDEPDFDPLDPAQHSRVAYYWLTAVQDTVVSALMR